MGFFVVPFLLFTFQLTIFFPFVSYILLLSLFTEHYTSVIVFNSKISIGFFFIFSFLMSHFLLRHSTFPLVPNVFINYSLKPYYYSCFKIFSGNSNSTFLSVCIYCLFSLTLGSSCFLVWQIIFKWNLDIFFMRLRIIFEVFCCCFTRLPMTLYQQGKKRRYLIASRYRQKSKFPALSSLISKIHRGGKECLPTGGQEW